MCLYQPNAPSCTCAFYQLLQPCSEAQVLPSTNGNPNPIIQACPNMYFARGVGERYCPTCCSKSPAPPSRPSSTAPTHPPILPPPGPGFVPLVAGPPRSSPRPRHLRPLPLAHGPGPGPRFPIHLPPLPPPPPETQMQVIHMPMQIPVPVSMPMPMSMPVLPPLNRTPSTPMNRETGQGPSGEDHISGQTGFTITHREVQAEFPVAADQGGCPVSFETTVVEERNACLDGGGAGPTTVEDWFCEARERAMQMGLDTGLLGGGRESVNGFGVHGFGDVDWDVDVKEEEEGGEEWFV